MMEIDSAERVVDLNKRILSKPALRMLYDEYYGIFDACIDKAPSEGLVIEFGSGAGFIKEIIPSIIRTDIIPYKNLNICLDATVLPFKNRSISAIFMLNTLHHISNAEALFDEACRCLKPRGRILIIDQYPGWLSYWILKYAHHEPFDKNTKEWVFKTTGPLSGANGALCWIIFFRDRMMFKKLFPDLRITSISKHTPLRYWLSGGLKSWCLLSKRFFKLAGIFDNAISKMFPELSSFVSIEIVRI